MFFYSIMVRNHEDNEDEDFMPVPRDDAAAGKHEGKEVFVFFALFDPWCNSRSYGSLDFLWKL